MRRRFAVWIRCLALTVVGAQAMADSALRHFDIHSQPTASALNEFARQADVTLVFSSAVVGRYQTAGIKGDFTIRRQAARVKVIRTRMAIKTRGTIWIITVSCHAWQRCWP